MRQRAAAAERERGAGLARAAEDLAVGVGDADSDGCVVNFVAAVDVLPGVERVARRVRNQLVEAAGVDPARSEMLVVAGDGALDGDRAVASDDDRGSGSALPLAGVQRHARARDLARESELVRDEPPCAGEIGESGRERRVVECELVENPRPSGAGGAVLVVGSSSQGARPR